MPLPSNIDPQILKFIQEQIRLGNLVLPDPDTGAPEQRLTLGYNILLQVRRKEALLTQIPIGLGHILWFVNDTLGFNGDGQPRPKGIFQPQRQDLTDAADTVLSGKREKAGEFFNVVVRTEDTQKLIEKARAIQGYGDLLDEVRTKVSNHLWPVEVDLYRIVSDTWSVVAGAYEKSKELRTWGPRLMTYMTERFKKGAQTRQENLVLEQEWDKQKSEQLKAQADEEARSKLADDLADSFVRRLEEPGTGGAAPAKAAAPPATPTPATGTTGAASDRRHPGRTK